MKTNRRIRFEYDLLNKDGVFKKKLYNVISCSVRYASLGNLKGSANVVMKDDKTIDFINDIIRARCIIDDKEYPLGEYLISSSKKNIQINNVKRDVQCYSKLLILNDDKIEDRLVCNVGTNVVNQVKRIIGARAHEITDSNLTIQTSKEWDVGTSKLQIINDLLSIINYSSIRTDGNGKFVASPYILPSEREIEFNLEAGSESIIYPEKSDELDLFGVPNVVIMRTNSGDIPEPLQAVYENNNVDSATSTPSRGRRIVHYEEVSDIINQELLNIQAKKRLYDLSDVYNSIQLSTAIEPNQFGFMKCIYLKTKDIEGKFIQTTCEIECKAGGRMIRTLRRAIKI